MYEDMDSNSVSHYMNHVEKVHLDPAHTPPASHPYPSKMHVQAEYLRSPLHSDFDLWMTHPPPQMLDSPFIS